MSQASLRIAGVGAEALRQLALPEPAGGDALDALRRSEDRYRTLVDSLDTGYCIIEMLYDDAEEPVDYRFIECNAAFERQTGLVDALGRRMRELAPAHEAHWFQIYGEIARTGEPMRFVREADALGGRWFDVYAFRTGAPEERRVAILFDDITQRRRTEHALRESEERFRGVANATPAILWRADARGETSWVSDRWKDVTGQPTDSTPAERSQYIHPDDRSAAALAWEAALADGRNYELEMRLRCRDGNYRWFLARATPRRDADGCITDWYGSTTDIHDQKQAQSVLRELDRRKDEFLATLAHELRNPLAPLRNCLHVLQLANEGQVDARQLHEVMARQVTQLVRLVDDLMEVSRITRGKIVLHMDTMRLADIVDNAVETSRPLLDAAGHKLQLELPAHDVRLRADPVRLAQILTNLLNNAAKYTPPGGHIVLSARTEPGSVVIAVRDDGLGIAPDQLRTIFDLFAQSDHSIKLAQGGLGIGLTLVRSLVELHGGEVIARSAGLGRGSEFEVRLPWSPTSSEPAVTPQPPRARSSPRPLRLLVVDDNAEHTDSLAMYLRMLGHAVRTASDAASALVWRGTFDPDAVLLDIGMPGVDGYEVCRRLRAMPGGAHLAIIALSGWGQDEDRQRSQAAGFDAHLVKPADPATLVALLAQLVHERAG